MTDAFRCDKCKEFAEGDPLAIVSVSSTEGGKNSERKHELCARCLDKHRRFMTYIDEPCAVCDAPGEVPSLSAVSIDVPFNGSGHHG